MLYQPRFLWTVDDPWCVETSADEALAAANVGVMQQLRSMTRKASRDKSGSGRRTIRDQWADAITGALAEQAACAALGVPWRPSSRGRTIPDAVGAQIRSTEHPGGHLLIYREDIRDWREWPFILVIGAWPYYKLAGWITCGNCEKQEYWKEDCADPCFWVPQEALTSMERFKMYN